MSNSIEYFITAEVDGIQVFSSSYPDTTILQEELYKAELAVEKQLQAETEMTYDN